MPTTIMEPSPPRPLRRTHALGIPPDGLLIMPVLQLLPISHERSLLLPTVRALETRKSDKVSDTALKRPRLWEPVGWTVCLCDWPAPLVCQVPAGSAGFSENTELRVHLQESPQLTETAKKGTTLILGEKVLHGVGIT